MWRWLLLVSFLLSNKIERAQSAADEGIKSQVQIMQIVDWT